MLARGKKIFVPLGEHGFSIFKVKIFNGSVRVLLTSASLKLKLELKKFVAPGEHGFSFFHVKILTGSVRVLLSCSLVHHSN